MFNTVKVEKGSGLRLQANGAFCKAKKQKGAQVHMTIRECQ